jgi:hypothetical protein
MSHVMHRRLPTAAFAVTLVMSAVAAAFAMDAAPGEDAVCTGRAPFREVVQDETYTFGELCSMREDFRRPDRGRTGANGIGWAKTSGPVLPRKH